VAYAYGVPQAPTLTSPAATGPMSPEASKDSRQGTATGTMFRFSPAPMWAENESTGAGVWAIRNSSEPPPGHDTDGLPRVSSPYKLRLQSPTLVAQLSSPDQLASEQLTNRCW
jgi:hypothetical protein